MDEKQKAALASKLSGDKAFDPMYTKQNRAWFARKVVDVVAATKPETQVEAEAKRVIGEANKRVKAERDFKIGVALDPGEATLERRDTARRVETLYGAIARTLELAETASDALRQFLVRRRYRGAVRMIYQVNPNSNGFFYYPGDCDQPPPAGRGTWRTNVETKDLWERFVGADMVPLRVKVPPNGTADPKSAAEKLWLAHASPCESNLFDCAHAICCVLMDSLFEAADSDKLFKAVFNRAREHLRIVHPFLFKEQHFLWEKPAEPQKLFSKEQVLPEDLQVGDHVFLTNHGLYPRLLPGGFWSGEHAIVTDCGTRKFADGKGFLFSGHGLDNPQTVDVLYDRLVKELQTAMHRVYAIAKIFLNFRRNPGSIPASKVQMSTFTDQKDDGTKVTVFGFDIEAPVKYGNYMVPPKKDGSPPMATEAGFLAFDIPDMKLIGIAGPHVDDVNKKGLSLSTPLRRTADPAAGGNNYDRTLWQIVYFDTDAGAEKTFPVFGGPKGSLRLIDRKEMPKFFFGRMNPGDKEAFTTRPTSDPSATYVSFLRGSGAIA